MPIVGAWPHVITASVVLLGLVLLVVGVRAEGDPEPESPPSPDHYYYQFYGYASDVTIDGEPLQTDDSITPILNGKAVTPALVGDNGFFLTFKHLFLEPPIGDCQVVYEVHSQQRAQTFTTEAFTYARGCGDIQVKLAIVTPSGNSGNSSDSNQADSGQADANADADAEDQVDATETSESEAPDEGGTGESQASGGNGAGNGAGNGGGPTLPAENTSTAANPEPDAEESEDEMEQAEVAEEDDLLEGDADEAVPDSRIAETADQTEAQASAAEVQRPAAPRTGTGGVYVRESTANWTVVASVLILLIAVIGLVTVLVKRRTDQSPH